MLGVGKIAYKLAEKSLGVFKENSIYVSRENDSYYQNENTRNTKENR